VTKTCQNCKTENLDEAKFCEKCGYDLSKGVNTPILVKKGKVDFLRRNWIASILGLIIGLSLTLISTIYINLYSIIIVLPLVSGVSSVYLANNNNYLEGIMIGIISIIILSVITIFFGIGIIFILIAAFGGFLGVLLNKYMFKSEINEDNQTVSRIIYIQKLWDKQGNGIRALSLLAVSIIGIALFASIISVSLGQMG
jgi:zinc-ribbon domain